MIEIENYIHYGDYIGWHVSASEFKIIRGDIDSLCWKVYDNKDWEDSYMFRKIDDSLTGAWKYGF